MKVLIAGGGIAGLTLAHGLRRAGLDCEAFERGPREDAPSGYRLTLDADGGQALEGCLAPDLYERYLQASHRAPSRPDVAVVIDSQCRELTTAPHIGPPNDGPIPHTAIDRRTFRAILCTGLTGVLHYDAAVDGFAADDDGVVLRLADGRTVAGDVLVGADGVASAVRRQLLPDVPIVPAPVGALGLFGRSPLTDEILAQLPEVLSAAFVIARDDRGAMLSLGQCVPRRGGPDVAAPYMMLSGGIAPGTPVPTPADWTAGTAEQLHAAMRAGVADWHPAIRGLVDRVDPQTLFSHPFRRLDPTPPWPASRVTLVGDAIHAMLPTLGKGANMAMRNAAVLRDALVAAHRGDVALVDAIAGYEDDMRTATYPLMELAADHDRFGGGGLRGPAAGQAPDPDQVSA
ncbi:MAG TPA: NAD(P)/FAD-dependent oxidoreductase [Solirubrobacteraceae bacterium]|jgi:2-polyprenyl-6-methoxyphenol hydroxylase-like FAD-dependent oxidoreductase|nr:NAD(P)/FAD-dependent oxidoreductase [Solirubrobacteraceae bacterium]